MCDKRFRYGPLHSNLHIAPAFATFCPIGVRLALVLFLFPFFSFAIREIHSFRPRYHEVIILTAFVAIREFENYIFFRFSVVLRFAIFGLFGNESGVLEW